MTKVLVLTTAAGILMSGVVKADCVSESHPWVLLGLDVHMGAVTERDTARDADTVSVCGEGLPIYRTKAECQVALRQAIQKCAGRSHAEGNFGSFLCTDIRTWTRGE